MKPIRTMLNARGRTAVSSPGGSHPWRRAMLLVLGMLASGCLGRVPLDVEGYRCETDDDCRGRGVCVEQRCVAFDGRREEGKDAGESRAAKDASSDDVLDAGALRDAAPRDDAEVPDAIERGDAGAVDTGVIPVVTDGNPFQNAYLHPRQSFETIVEAAMMNASLQQREKLPLVARVPTASWITNHDNISIINRDLTEALARRPEGAGPALSVFVIKALTEPKASCMETRAALDMMMTSYKQAFIGDIHAALSSHATQRVVILLEPFVVAHLTTTLGSCAAERDDYHRLLGYAIWKLSSLPHVSIYLDLAHVGWLGKMELIGRVADSVAAILDAAQVIDSSPVRLRGFSTNVTNYNVLQENSPERFSTTDHLAGGELRYTTLLTSALDGKGVRGKSFLIDTSRNGRSNVRSSWASWCNIAGAGFGPRPAAEPELGVDAYFWIKTPGLSDGGPDISACTSTDSLANAPAQGHVFPSALLQLLDNANPSF